jgi:hypothetical protein
MADGQLTVALDGYGWGHLALRSFAADGRPDTGSAPSLTDRFYDMGWPQLPPADGASTLLSTRDGETGCKTITITVKVDDRLEPTESIWVELTDPVGAGLAMDKARLYIAYVQASGSGTTPPRDSSRGGGGAAGSGLLLMLAGLACLRRFARVAVARWRHKRPPLRSMRITSLATACVSPVSRKDQN